MGAERKIVMLVDDDAEFLAELREALALSGYIPVPVDNPADAVKTARRIRPDAILLDLKLGTENGYSVAGKIRKNPATARIPVILMSAYFRDPARKRAHTPANIKLCLNKPFTQRDVILSIQTTLADKKKDADSSLLKHLLLGPKQRRIRRCNAPAAI